MEAFVRQETHAWLPGRGWLLRGPYLRSTPNMLPMSVLLYAPGSPRHTHTFLRRSSSVSVFLGAELVECLWGLGSHQAGGRELRHGHRRRRVAARVWGASAGWARWLARASTAWATAGGWDAAACCAGGGGGGGILLSDSEGKPCVAGGM